MKYTSFDGIFKLCATGEANRKLQGLGLKPFLEPRGGMFLWCQLPDGLDAADVARRALADNIVLAPGNVFSVSQTATRFLRFNVAQSSDPRVFAAVERAMRE